MTFNRLSLNKFKLAIYKVLSPWHQDIPGIVSVLNNFKHILNIVHHSLSQANNIHFLLSVLQHSQFCLVGQQIEKLKQKHKWKPLPNNVEHLKPFHCRSQRTMRTPWGWGSWTWASLAAWRRRWPPWHRCLSCSPGCALGSLHPLCVFCRCQSVRKRSTSPFPPQTQTAPGAEQWTWTHDTTLGTRYENGNWEQVPVDHFIGGRVVEGVIKAEMLVFQEFGEVDFLLWLVHHHLVFVWNRNHIYLFASKFCKISLV